MPRVAKPPPKKPPARATSKAGKAKAVAPPSRAKRALPKKAPELPPGKYPLVAAKGMNEIRKKFENKPLSTGISKGFLGAANTIVQLSNSKERKELLDEAAEILSDRETALLPTYGGRQWKVVVEIVENERKVAAKQKALDQEKEERRKLASERKNKASGKGSKKTATKANVAKKTVAEKNEDMVAMARGPLFRVYRGLCELATLPHLLEEVDVRILVDLKDVLSYRVIAEYDATLIAADIDFVTGRNKTDKGKEITNEAVDEDRAPPIIKRYWLSPQYEKITSWETVVERCKDYSSRERTINRVIFGIGGRGGLLAPKKPSKTDALEAGKFRFDKDGLWVIGQEDAWQASNETLLTRSRALGLGIDEASSKKKGKKKAGFREKTGKGMYCAEHRVGHAEKRRREISVVERKNAKNTGASALVAKKLPPPPKIVPAKLSKGGYVEDDKPLRPPPKKKAKGADRVAKGQFSVKDADVELGKIWDDELSANDRRHWEGMAELENVKMGEAEVLKEREAQEAESKEERRLELENRDSHLQYLTDPPTEEEIEATKDATPLVGQVCKVRFDDGDWYRGLITTVLVVKGVLDQRKEEKLEEKVAAKKWELKILYEDKQVDTTVFPDPFVTLLPMDCSSGNTSVTTTTASDLAVSMPTVKTQGVGSFGEKQDRGKLQVLPPPPAPLPVTEGKVDKEQFATWHSYRVVQWRNDRVAKNLPPAPVPVEDPVLKAELAAKAEAKAEADKERKKKVNEGFVDASAKIYSPAEDTWEHVTCVAYNIKSCVHSFQYTKTKFVEVNIEEHVIMWDKDLVIPKSEYWRLKPHQITKCLDAANEHYEAVMHTVRSRGLHHELQDGFDMMRERGFGRYDMTIPAYDTEPYSFLQDREAPWMSVVKQCLGNDCKLIHKGCFMSLPGSHHQVYHQDGVHLNEKKQLDCHAVNVFIPLVDLSLVNGATEFVLGTHILENDGYDRSKLYTPTAPAGTPIIFDYRLGHRGMGNSTDETRPILYLTYSAEDKFSDSINFSARRYHKLGSMVEAPVSREERKAKREQEVELDRIQGAKKIKVEEGEENNKNVENAAVENAVVVKVEPLKFS